MLSWTGQTDLWQQLISDSDATNLTMGKTLIREGQRKLPPILGIYFTEETRTFLTVNYTTGTITTLMNYADTDATKVVTGASSVWTATMVGRYFRIDVDGEWYRIASRSSDTSITLAQFYRGVAISAGTSAYTIGQMPPTRSEEHELPVYYACWKYYLFRKDITMA